MSHRTPPLAAVSINAIALAGLLLGAALAHGVAPVKGASYRGTLAEPRDHIEVRWRVSGDGKEVRRLKTSDTPFFCEGGGLPLPARFKNAAISEEGTFRSKATLRFASGPREGEVQARLKIKGRFLKRRRARGTVEADWTGGSACDGQTTYRAKVV